MTARNTWKQRERDVAEFFHGQRNPLSGGNSKHTRADVIHDRLYIECKLRENVCRYEYNEVCLGVVTRAGCGAPCPTAGFWCFGCRGYVDDPNIHAAKDIMDRYGKTVEDLKSRMLLFGSKQEHTDE